VPALCVHLLGSQAPDDGAADASADAKRPKLSAPSSMPSLAPLAAPPQTSRAAALEADVPFPRPTKPAKSLMSPPSSKRPASAAPTPASARPAQDLTNYDDDDDFADD
jgi:hypothetical protein